MYRILLSRNAEKFVRGLGKKYQKRIGEVIKSFQESSFPYPYSKIKGEVNTYRIRVGEYRIVYEVDKIENIIRILKIDKRGRVYDR
jgi:mRNA interferase RelE/StbE